MLLNKEMLEITIKNLVQGAINKGLSDAEFQTALEQLIPLIERSDMMTDADLLEHILNVFQTAKNRVVH